MNIGNWLQSWLNVLTRPGEPVFEEERVKAQANWTTTLIWVALLALISGVFALIRGAMFARVVQSQVTAAGGLQGLLDQLNLPADVAAQLNAQLNSLPAGMVPFVGRASFGINALLGGVFWAIVSFVIFVALLQLVAKLLGGTGNFGKYAYLLAAAWVPLQAVSSVLGIVPWAGGCVALLLWIYQLVLSYYATRVEHKLAPGRAIIVVLVPLLLVLLVVCCVSTLAAGLIGAVMNTQR